MPLDYAKIIPQVIGAEIFNVAYVTPNTFYTAALKPKHTPTVFEIWICMDTGGNLTIQRINNSVTVSEKPGVAQSMTASQPVDFEIRVHVGDTINFTYSASAQILSFSVVELDGETA